MPQSSAPRVPLREYLAADTKRVLVLDGGLATQLEARGCDLNDPLWSGKTLLDQPDMIEAVAADYYTHSARCVITASYQATPQGLCQQRPALTPAAALDAVTRSVTLADHARRQCEAQGLGPLYVAGSVGPYGAFLANGAEYRGDYSLSVAEFDSFHRPRIDALIRGGVDVLALETQPCFDEIKALVRLVEREHPDMPVWVTITTHPEHRDTQLADGTPFATLVPWLDAAPNVLAVGVNCVPLASVAKALATLSHLTSKPLVAYPNSGEEYDPKEKVWYPARDVAADGTHGEVLTLSSQCEAWCASGARLVGGCCRTTPVDIKALATHLQQRGYLC